MSSIPLDYYSKATPAGSHHCQMDCLDSNLHSQILSSLAANLASSSTQDDLGLLTDSFSSVEPVTNGLVSGVLSRVGLLGKNGGSTAVEVLTQAQADGIIAYAQYASTAIPPSTTTVNRITALLESLPRWEVEQTLGLQTLQDWSPADQMAYELVRALLHLTSGGIGDRTNSLNSLKTFQKSVLVEIEDSPAYRIISHLLPILNGTRRAITFEPFTWRLSDPEPCVLPLENLTFDCVTDALSQEWDPYTSDGRRALSAIATYSTTMKGVAPGLISLCVLEEYEQFFTASLVGGTENPAEDWARLYRGGFTVPPKNSSSLDVHSVVKSALDIWTKTLEVLDQNLEDDTVAVDPYSFDILLKCVKVAALGSIVYGHLDGHVTILIESLVSDSTPVTEGPLQTAAVQCLQALCYAFPTLLSQATGVVRRFILSPSPVFDEDGELSASSTLHAAAISYASCLFLAGSPSLRPSALQSLLNHLSTTDTSGSGKNFDAASIRSGSGKSAVSANVAHAAGILALEFKDEGLYHLVVSILLQKLQGQDALVGGAIMFELAQLAQDVDTATFKDIVRAICDVSKSTTSNNSIGSTVLTALNRLTTSASARPDLHEGFLIDLLSLFVDKGSHTSSLSSEKISTNADLKSDGLLELIPIIDMFLVQSKLDPRRKVEPSLVALFRNMWYLCNLRGFLTSTTGSKSRIEDWQRACLVRIAKHTPALLRGANDDFVETELEYNSILRQTNHPVSLEQLRLELISHLSANVSTSLKTLSAPQVIFLSTVLKVESLRAEAGQPSIVLHYFHVEGINNSLLHNPLVSIARQVNSHFIALFSERVTTHSMDPSVFGEIREMMLECSHQYAAVRTVALSYVNDLVTSFPSLACDATVVTVLLEMLTVLRRACQSEFEDEYTPSYRFHSNRAHFTIVLPDDYEVRNTILSDLHQYARSWLKTALTRAPFEMQGLLQDYIDVSANDNLTHLSHDDEMGKSVAIDLIRTLPPTAKDASLPSWGNWKADNSSHFARTFGARSFYGGEASQHAGTTFKIISHDLHELSEQLRQHKLKMKLTELRALFYKCAGYIVKSERVEADLLRQVVFLPARIFTEGAVALAQEVWTWIADARPDLESRLMVEVVEAWTLTIVHKQGLFSNTLNRENPLDQETKFTPTDKDLLTKEYSRVTHLLQPHAILLAFISSRFQSFRYKDRDLVLACMRLLLRSTRVCKIWSTHALARELRMTLLNFGFCVLQGSKMESCVEANLRTSLYDAALSWFAIRPGWSFGGNRIQIKADLQAVEELSAVIKTDTPLFDFFISSQSSSREDLPGRQTAKLMMALHHNRQQLILALLDNESDRLRLWQNPMLDTARGNLPQIRGNVTELMGRQLVRIAWSKWPEVAVYLPERFKLPAMTDELTRLVRSEPLRVQHVSDALPYFIGETITPDIRHQLRYLLYWEAVPVIYALRFLFPKFGGDPILLQYALRVLEHHPVEVTFFYIPQVVQALRTDALGYAERFIFETSKISQLFCHQIIWNMKANAYRGDAGEEADPMKPTLDRMIDMIVGSLSGEAKDFYQREFGFFDEVTSISAKLKPYIKSPKHEKKAKIDEEMAKIKVDPGVYLPSNPDGVVVDIDRKSGRPLQSHAKAPFMATFKVRRERKTNAEAQEALIEMEMEDTEDSAAEVKGFDTWQSAIFKVGDDCRQDVLALQIIAMFKNIFNSLGLDLLVTPYRVTATGPGCGVIDVIPNATSRDEMGRAKVNDLRSFFLLKYGSADSVEFQKARTNFIQSMAAYSVLCHIVQIKDRHNGNIMIDGRGCITHIDFGFLFDIGPGGVKFEPESFKLTHEMITLMGGRNSVGFRQFSELTVKAFLACRPFGQAVVDVSGLMMAAEFPSFKGEPTMQRLKDRFALDLTEAEAAKHMVGIINNALENPRSIVYDEFQRITNGIPYVR